MHRNSIRLPIGLIFPMVLYACGTPSSPSSTSPNAAAPGVYGDGLNHSWASSAADGQRLLTTLSRGLKAQNINVGLTLSATNGWGPIEVNTSNGETLPGDGRPLSIGGQGYATGLGVHAESEIHIHAIGLETPACTRFQADVGVDDEVGRRGSVTFQVFADGQKLFDSGEMTGGMSSQHIDVALGGKSDLRFVVLGGTDYYYDHADWANPSLYCSVPQAQPSVTLDTSRLNIYHLHTSALHATFHNYPKGPVQLQLVSDPSGDTDPFNSRESYPLVLQTTQLELSGDQTENKDIVVAAPVKPMSNTGKNAKFFLKILASGGAMASLPVTLVELPINFTARFEPSSLSGRSGETKTAALIVTADPPLDAAQALDIQAGLPPLFQPYNSKTFKFSNVGETSGTGAEMQQTVSVTFLNDGRPIQDLPFTANSQIGVAVGEITTGYRDAFYGPAPLAPIQVSLLP